LIFQRCRDTRADHGFTFPGKLPEFDDGVAEADQQRQGQQPQPNEN
jgi:hypothetical protein